MQNLGNPKGSVERSAPFPILAFEGCVSRSENLVRRLETNKGTGIDRGRNGATVISYMHQVVFSHGAASREAVGVHQLGHHIGAEVATTHTRKLIDL